MPASSLLALILAVGPARADTPLAVLDADLRGVFEDAEAAWKAGRLDDAEAGFTAVVESRPDFDRAWRRRCGLRIERHRPTDARLDCRQAVALKASVENRTGLAIALLPDLDDPADVDTDTLGRVAEAREALTAALTEQPDYLPAWQTVCAWGQVTGDVEALSECVPELVQRAPDQPTTDYFRAWLAMERGHLKLASESLRRARDAGLPEATLQPAMLRFAQLSLEARVRAEGGPAAAEQGPTPVAEATRVLESDWTAADIAPLAVLGVLVLVVGGLVVGGRDDAA